MKFIKLISFFVAVLILLTGCLNSVPVSTNEISGDAILEEDENPDLDGPFNMRVPFDYDEGLSPYTTKSRINRFICNLIYRSMVTLNGDYSYEIDLLSDIKNEGFTTWYLYVEADSVFPNGTEFTAYDIKYSIQCAMAENSYYAKSLDSVSTVSVVNSTCCKVVLNFPCRYFPNLLVFPVISYQTESRPVYFDGRYSLSDDGKRLVANVDSLAPTIELISSSDPELLPYEMRTGTYDCIYVNDPFSLGNSSTGGMSGLQSNNLVYLGFNVNVSFAYYSDFRKAVSLGIDYSKLCSESYQYYAEAPRGIFNPNFYEMKYTSRRSSDLISASLLLDDMGFTNFDSEGYRLTSRGRRVSVSLLVCNESTIKTEAANAIAEMLKEIGIEVKIVSRSYSSYLNALESGSYEMYLAEVHLDSDMDMSLLLTPRSYQLTGKNYATYGTAFSEALYLSYLDFMYGNISATEFCNKFSSINPFVPLCYTKSCVVFSRDLPFSISAPDFDMFYGITA